jgi:23S rRNA (adenine2503-C2)-methyltransferase
MHERLPDLRLRWRSVPDAEPTPRDSPAAALLGRTHGEHQRLEAERGTPAVHALSAYQRFFRAGAGEEASEVARVRRVLEDESDEGPVYKFLLPVEGQVRPGNAPARTPEREALAALPIVDQDLHAERAARHTLETESVVIPMVTRGGVSRTLCVSSQVGCAMGCAFCETAQMGLIRSLGPAEIVQQWHAARHQLGATIKNIVFMGMGEPLDNADAVINAIEILTDHHGPAIAMKNITVSTVGRLDGMALLADAVRRDGWKRLNLAVSVNAPNDEIRSRIMPINRATPLAELVRAMREWPLRTSAAICCEYVLIPGENDRDEHADELCALLRGVRCCVNVIPYNPRRDSPWPAPAEADVERFLARLEANGQFCKRRRTKGRASMAACGQLGNEHIRRRRLVPTA